MTIDDFCKKLNDFERQYPADASDSLEEGAKKMVKAIKRDTPIGKSNHKRKLNKSWKMRMSNAWGKEPKAEIRNIAPHYHLVERGVKNPKDSHGNPKPEWQNALNKHKGFFEKSVQKNWAGVTWTMETTFFEKVRGHIG